RDAGGERQLLSVPLPDDEPVHVLRVVCPSMAHGYLLRVPPHVRTCRRDAGGERQLLSVPLPDDEPVHVLRVVCPSMAHG
ncbi:hypothetical protein, partial [Hymenobacter coccineus]|uniref:hypothetical protein n=1 Tax=Hymenobacter coccineus TaxID=1908235 RepID=UPI001955BD73